MNYLEISYFTYKVKKTHQRSGLNFIITRKNILKKAQVCEVVHQFLKVLHSFINIQTRHIPCGYLFRSNLLIKETSRFLKKVAQWRFLCTVTKMKQEMAIQDRTKIGPFFDFPQQFSNVVT